MFKAPELTNPVDALALALALSIVADTDEQFAQATAIVEAILPSVAADDVEVAKTRALAMADQMLADLDEI